MFEDIKLKKVLILQSFCPLFILIFIKHIGHFDLVYYFLKEIINGNFKVFKLAIRNPYFGEVVINIISILWFIITLIVTIGFRELQNGNYNSYGEMIRVKSEKKDAGISFLVTYIMPLLVDDVTTVRGFVFFCSLLFIEIYLLIKSDLFYQSPVLTVLKYKTYEFSFVNPNEDVQKDRTYIGISKTTIPFEKEKIKRKYISDGVFLISNDSRD